MAVIDVTEDDFEPEVIERSKETPVVVDFWADVVRPVPDAHPDPRTGRRRPRRARSCWPSSTPTPTSAFAAVRIQGIPAVKAFRDGKVVDEFVGALAAGRSSSSSTRSSRPRQRAARRRRRGVAAPGARARAGSRRRRGRARRAAATARGERDEALRAAQRERQLPGRRASRRASARGRRGRPLARPSRRSTRATTRRAWTCSSTLLPQRDGEGRASGASSSRCSTRSGSITRSRATPAAAARPPRCTEQRRSTGRARATSVRAPLGLLPEERCPAPSKQLEARAGDQARRRARRWPTGSMRSAVPWTTSVGAAISREARGRVVADDRLRAAGGSPEARGVAAATCAKRSNLSSAARDSNVELPGGADLPLRVARQDRRRRARWRRRSSVKRAPGPPR